MVWAFLLALLAQSTTGPDRMGGDVVEKNPSLSVGASNPDTSDDLDLRPNVGPEPMPPVTTWRAYASLIMLGSGAILTCWLLSIWLRRPRPVRIPPPDEWALAELDRLDKQPPVSDDDVRRYCTQVSSILRQFLDRRFGFRAVEQTTPEFVASLQAANTLRPAQKDSLIELLQRADLVKFAAVVPDAAGRAGLIGQVRDFIRTTSVKSPPQSGS